MKQTWILLSLALSLSACTDVTHVQMGYVSDRDECRSRAENRVGLYNQPGTYPISEKEKNTTMVSLFNECMREFGWNIGGTKKEKEIKEAKAPAPPPPPPATVVVVQSPQVPASQPVIVPQAAPAPVPAACPAPAAPKPSKGKRPRPKPKGATPVACPSPEEQATFELEKAISRP